MKPWLLPSVVLLSLSATLLRADYASTPLDAALTQQAPYKYAGIVVNDADSYRGSGAVVGNSRLVISCAHLPFNGNTLVWSTDNLWYRAYESSAPLTNAAGQVLRGYWKFDSYASMVSAHGQNSDEAFAKDFTAYYGYEDLGPGSARFWYDGQAALVSPASKIIVGYPSGNYAAGDSRQNMMHGAGPFPLAFTQIMDGNYKIATVTTGDGNSGGPVFVADESSLTDPDQGLRFAAVLLYGYDDISGGPIVGAGVLAVTSPEWDLVNSSLNAIGLAPLNDSWAAALKLFGDTVSDTASNQYATKESGEPNHAGNAGGHSIWWRWVAPGDGPVALNTQGSTCDTLLAVYTGSSVSSLTVVASNDDTGGITSALNFTAAATTEYWIAADGKNGTTGTVTLNLSFAPPSAPANDVFANATAISGISAQVIGNNINATKEPGEPDFTYNDGSGRTSVGGKSVWWEWTAPADGQVFLTTAGTSFDTLLSVYTGTAVNALTLVASDDDPPDTSNDSSTLTFAASGGTTYWISVSGWTNATHLAGSGAVRLSLNLTPNFPVIVVQPSSQTPNIGDSMTLIVAARGAAPLTYQWYQNSVAISGATNATYRIASSQTTDAGDYTVVVTNNNGSVTSNIATLTVHGYPVISAQPVSQAVSAGNTATFTVIATSDTPLTYQWTKDGANLADGDRISGSTSATLTVSTAQTSDAGSYTVVVTNTTGSVTSLAVTLAVIPVLSSGGIVSISAGGAYNLLLGSDGSLWAVGENTYGQLGDGTFTFRNRPEQVATGVVAAFAGGSHSLFLKSDGSMWGMGNDTAGQLGDGKGYGFQASSIRIATGVVAASAGANHSLFIKSDGTLWAMGDNAYGQLGDGTLTNRIVPEQVASGIVATSAGQTHSLFIKSDGTLWATGDNSFGQLGDGTTTARQTPVQVATGVVAASAGSGYSLFLKSDGSLWAAGENTSGQLGDGTSINRATPVQVANAVTAVAAGGDHCLFLKSDSTLWGMGSNTSGQLGLGSNPFSYSDYRNTPVQVTGGVVAASAGQSHSLYLGSDGTVWAMGNNYYGQLGDGTNTNRSLPVPVIGGTAEVPGAPVGATASAGTVVNAVLLTWNPTIGAARYEVWRNTADSLSGASRIAGNLTASIYYDQTVPANTPYYYWVDALNQAGVSGLSNSFSGFLPLIAPSITAQPRSQLAVSAQNIIFSITGDGSPAPSYQWQISTDDGVSWSDLANDATYSGVSTNTLAVSDATLAMRGNQFRCVVSNGAGSINSIAVVLTVNPALVITTLAGRAGTSGSNDGNGSAAEFFLPEGLAVDRRGNLYVADTANHLIRKITPAGLVSTLSGRVGTIGSADGTGSTAQFGFPRGLAIDSASNIYVADSGNRTIRKITPAGVVTTLAGVAGYRGDIDGIGSAARFDFPVGLATDSVSNVYVVDSGDSMIRKITPAGVVTTLAGSAGNRGNTDGTGSAAQFYNPQGLSVDNAGNVYVADTGNSTIRKITPAGVVTTLAGSASNSGSVDGTGSAAQFYGPQGTAVDSAGNVYVTDGNSTIRKVTPTGVVTTLAGLPSHSGTADGTGSTAQFFGPHGITIDSNGVIYVADSGNCTIRKCVLDGVPLFTMQPSDLAVMAGQNASFTVAAIDTRPLTYQWQQSADGGSTWIDLSSDNTYSGVTSVTLTVTDTSAAMTGDQFRCVVTNSLALDAPSFAAMLTVQIVPPAPTTDPAGAVIAGGFSAAWNAVGSASGYRLDVSSDSSFGSFVSGYQDLDLGNVTTKNITGLNPNTTYYYRVRGYNSAGTGPNSSTAVVTTSATVVIAAPLTVSTLAGQPLSNGSADGTGTSARFYYPSGAAVDSAGNLYVADTDNDTIRKVAVSTGAVTTLAGLAGNSGNADGTGSAARFNSPSGVAVDGAGNVYVADTLNHTLRRVTSQGVVSTLAGATGSSGSTDGTGSAAQFQGPQGLAIDSASNLYVADTNNHTIRKVVLSTGAVTTVAGLAGNSGSVDGLGSLARFNFPSGVAVDGAGNLYVADTENHTIREILPTGLVNTLAGLAGNSGGADGVGSAARFDSPSAVAVDLSGNVYVADTDNHTVRKVVPASGSVSTLAGLAGTSGSTDGVGTVVRFFAPAGIAVDSNSNLYMADTNNYTIRLGLLATMPSIQTQPLSQTVIAGSSVQFSVTASGRPALTYQWSFNNSAISGATGSSYSLASAQSGNAGNYTVTVANTVGSVTSNQATLTVNAATPPPSGGGGGGGDSGGGGGGGGGAPSWWFFGALLLLAAVRRRRAVRGRT